MNGQNTFSSLTNMLDYISTGAILIAVVSLVVLILWEQSFIKNSFLKIIPGPLAAVLAGIGLNILFAEYGSLSLRTDQLVSIPVSTSVGEFFGQFTLPDWSQLANPQIYIVGLTIAVVASLETLLCVEATDKLDPDKRITPTSRELIAQGVGNMVSGLIGGLPVTQVIVRSSANIQSGGKSKASAFFHGIFLLASVLAISKILNLIPLASLAAILLVVGYKLAKPALFKEMFSLGKAQFVPFIITIVGIVFIDLLIGIALGMVVAVMNILWNNYKTPYHFNPDEYVKGRPIKIELSEDVSFLNKAGIMHTFTEIPNNSHVIIDGSKSKSIHYDIREIIEDFKQNAISRSIKVELIGFGRAAASGSIKEFGHIVLQKPKTSTKRPA